MADVQTVSIVVPAYNEAGAIGPVVRRLRESAWHEVIVIDDGSTDTTAEEAREAGARVVSHPYNKGNGAAVKSGIRVATGEFVLIIDADGQHRPEDARRLVDALGTYDLVVGARDARTQECERGRRGRREAVRYEVEELAQVLPPGAAEARRQVGNLVARDIAGQTVQRAVAHTAGYAGLRAGYNVTFLPVQARPRQGRSKIRFLRDGAKFTLIVLKVVTVFSPLRVFGPISLTAFAVGAVYGAWTAMTRGRIPNGAVLLMLFGAIVFLVGLVSEQIAALRAEGRE